MRPRHRPVGLEEPVEDERERVGRDNGGSALQVLDYSVTTNWNTVHAGGSYLFGFQHTNGFFADFRVGGGSFVPQLKMGVGWAVELK